MLIILRLLKIKGPTRETEHLKLIDHCLCSIYTGDHYVEIFSNEDIDPDNANAATGTFNLEATELFDDHGGIISYKDDRWLSRS